MQKKIKVALMSYAMDNRAAKGTALYTRQLIQGLLGDEQFEFYGVHYDEVTDPLYKKMYEIIMPRVTLPYGSRFISQLLFFWKYRNDQFDIIHWFQPRVYPLYWLAPAKKILVTMHGAGDISAPTRFVFSRMVFNFVLKYMHQWIDKVIVVSQNAKEEVVRYYNFLPQTIAVIYNGGGENFVPLDSSMARTVVAQKYGVTSAYIFDLSRLVPHKNVATLIKAYEVMRRTHTEHTEKLVIVGGAMSEQTEEYVIARASLFSQDIVFIGFVAAEDLNALYCASSLFVFPSLSEGFGLPVLEAMASGVPVITSNVTSMPEIGATAVLTIDPRDVDKLATAMHTVLTDTNIRNGMIIRGLERAKEFTWSTMVERTKDLYIEIVT